MSVRASVGAEVRYRVIDMRTESGFSDEAGRRLESVASEGTAFFVAGDYVLLCLTTGDAIDFPEDAGQAWAAIPERVYVEDREAIRRWWSSPPNQSRPDGQPDGAQRDGIGAERRHRATRVQTSPGPVVAGPDLVREGERTIGTPSISACRQRQRLPVGETALARGVLLGRSGRCDADSNGVLGYDAISRVHALVLRVRNQLCLIDTASTNGLFDAAEFERTGSWERSRTRVTTLEPEQQYALGEGAAWIRWRAS